MEQVLEFRREDDDYSFLLDGSAFLYVEFQGPIICASLACPTLFAFAEWTITDAQLIVEGLAVPEPSVAILLGLGLLGTTALRLRRSG